MGELRFGLLGEKLSHSFSMPIHTKLGTDNYKLIEVSRDELASFFAKNRIGGLNVTIPYKKEVMKYLFGASSEAYEIGAVNTIVPDANGRLIGYNTDAFGFSYLLKKNEIDVEGKKVLVLGSGGAANAVVYVLEKLGAAEIVIISRKGDNNYNNLYLHEDAQIIINATPVGMYPMDDESLIDMYNFPNAEAVVDLIYNPLRTGLMLDAMKYGVKAVGGLLMLVAQAVKTEELIQNKNLENRIDEIYEELLHEMQNIAFVGMPGSGKTTAGRKMAKELGKEFFDTDEMVKERTGRSPEEIIENDGEERFREIESDCLRRALNNNGVIISTGGGIVTRQENVDILRRRARIIYVERPIEELSTNNRPISKAKGVENLFRERGPIYEGMADEILRVSATLEREKR